MQNFIRGLNSKLAVFIISIAIIILAAIVFEQYMLSRQKEDARLIRLAGRQSMLIQKLTKTSLFIEGDLQKSSVKRTDIESLKDIALEISLQHTILISFVKTEHNNDLSDSLVLAADPLVQTIVQACEIAETENQTGINKALRTIHLYDQSLSNLSEQLVTSYQNHADRKMNVFKKAQYIIGASVFIAIGFGFMYILFPFFKSLRSGNKNLEELNVGLLTSNEALLEAEQKSREGLEEIKRLHDDLSIKENQYRTLIESADNMIYELDENGRFIFVNPTTEAVTGFTRQELYEKLLWEIVHPNHKENVIQFYFQQRKRQQKHSYYELPIVTATRKTVWIGQSASMVFHKHEGLSRLSVIARDVTNLKMTQLKLENSEKLYRLISTNSKDLVSIYNYVEDSPIRTYVSPSVKDILGYTPEELIGKVPFDIMLAEDGERMKKTSHIKVMSGKPTLSEYRVYKKDGSIAWLEAFAEPFFDDAKKVIGFQTSARDITLRIDNEAKLNEARLKAEQATLAKSQFLSMMSHEIRTPLNGIIGLTNFLLEDKPSPEQLQYLKLLKFSGDNLLTIINDVLDFSKIEANEIYLENIPFNLHQLLENALQTLRIRATDKGIPLMLTYDSTLPAVFKGDPVRLSQIINNLVGNAIKFTSSGFISVQVLFTGKTDDTYSVTFSVKDTGIGIAANKLDYIFESFTQAAPDMARKFGGTGLGLSITKRLIQLMGSSIVAVSEIDKGTEFTFSLNLEKAPEPRDTNSSFNQVSNEVRSITVLLVDDNDVNLIVAGNYLKKWGFSVSTAVNGVEAVEKISQKSFNLVLMDLQMPEMDGYQATRRIRSMSEEYFKEVPIIALTASAMVDDIHRLFEVGINDYVAKPFNPGELREKILKYALATVPSKGLPDTFSLDDYSGGDAETNKVLMSRMIDNLKELREALYYSVEHSSASSYRSAIHKIQTTISILNDEKFNLTIENLKKTLTERNDLANRLTAEMELFSRQCNDNIAALLRTLEGPAR